MDPGFNAYHKWLGIPLADQPAHHYRLLGISCFEGDPDVIQAAADQRMSHLKTFQRDEHIPLAQQLLNEVAAARTCLLHPAKKAAYDEELRRRLAAEQATASPPPVETLEDRLGLLLGDALQPASPPPLPPRPAAATGSARWKRAAGLGAIAALLALVVLVATVSLLRPPAIVEIDFEQDETAATPSPGPVDQRFAEVLPPPAKGEGRPSPPVAPPRPLSPSRGMPLPNGTSDGKQSFVWQFTWMPIGGAQRYQFRLQSPAATTPLVDVDRLTMPVYRYSRVGFIPESERRDWQWQVRAEVRGQWTAWSEPARFDVSPPNLPPLTPPTLIAPPPGEELANGDLDGGKPPPWLFQWSVVPGATKYHLMVRAPGSGTLVVNAQEIVETSYSYRPVTTIDNARRLDWHWRVRAWVDGRWSNWSGEQAFRVALAKSVDDGQRLPLPEETVRKEARSKIDKALASEMEEATESRTKQLALATMALEQAKRTVGDWTSRYALYEFARDQAIRAGDFRLAFKIVRRLACDYDVRPVAMRAAVVEQAYASVRGPSDTAALVERTVQVVEELAAEGEADTAERLLGLAREKVRNGEAKIGRTATARAKAFTPWRQQQKEAEAALETLKTKPDDAAAAGVAAAFLCLAQGDWEKGLPWMAKSANEPLAAAAKRELAGANTPEEQIALGDLWWSLAESSSKEEKPSLLLRAKTWYAQVLPALSGLTKVRVQKRLEKIADVSPPFGYRREADDGTQRVKLEPRQPVLGTLISYVVFTRIALSETPAVPLKAQPRYRSAKPLYAAMTLGDGPDNPIVVALDEPEGDVPRIYIDRNNDKDLTNDGPGDWQQTTPVLTLSKVEMRVSYRNGVMPYVVDFQRMRDLRMGNVLLCGRNACRTGTLVSDGVSYPIAVVEDQCSGRFDDLAADTMFIDLNRDGKLEGRKNSAENHHLDRAFNIHGETWRVVSLSPDGVDLRLRPSRAWVEMQAYLKIGTEAIPFTAEALDGRKVDLRQEAAGAKCVLLDFWASWYPPSRQDFPRLSRLHQEYKGGGLRIVGISLDDSREEAQATAKAAGLDYPHIFDGRREGAIAKLYRVQMPHTMLLDGNLKILATNLRGDALEARLRELLGPPSE